MKLSTMRLIKAADRAPLISEGDSITHVTTRLGGTVNDVCDAMRTERRTGQLVIHWNQGGVMGIEFLTLIYHNQHSSIDKTP